MRRSLHTDMLSPPPSLSDAHLSSARKPAFRIRPGNNVRLVLYWCPVTTAPLLPDAASIRSAHNGEFGHGSVTARAFHLTGPLF